MCDKSDCITNKYLGHVWTFNTKGISLHFNYIQKYTTIKIPRGNTNIICLTNNSLIY